MADTDITGQVVQPPPLPASAGPASGSSALANWNQDLSSEEATVQAKQAEFDKEHSAFLDTKDKAMKPLEADLSKSLDQPMPTRPEHVTMPVYDDKKPIVSGQEFEGLGMGLLAMAMIGGAKSHGNWLGVSSALNGTMQGFIDGKEEEAAKAYKDYKTKFEAAKEQEEQANKAFQDVLEDRKLTINEKIQRISVLGAQYDRQDMRFAAKEKSIDKMWEQLNAHRSALHKADAAAENLHVTIDARQDARASAKETDVTDDDAAFRAEQAWAGSKDPYKGISAYDKAGRMKVDAAILEQGKALGKSGADIVAKQAETAGETKALAQGEQRAVAVARLGDSIQAMGPILDRVAQEGTAKLGTKFMNTSVQDLKDQLQDPAVGKLDVVMRETATQFIEAMTMPGSNAQMHEGARQVGEALLNRNMSYKQIKENYALMREITQQNKGVLDNIVKEESNKISGRGGKITVSNKTELKQQMDAGKLKKGDIFYDPDGNAHVVN
jgi:hypothetical protein